MAQIAIPVLLVGVAYLMSNDKEEERKEGFSLIDEKKNQSDGLLANENKTFHPNVSETKNNVNNEETFSQHQDKYFLKQKNVEKSENEFENLAGNRVKYGDINHNNMNMFYSSKMNGYNDPDRQSVLDTYTGQGTYDIKKEEIAPLFRPETNSQNVYGNQNQNDFMQSRMNSSQRHANTKPWEEIKDTPGIGMKYNEQSSEGFGNYMNQRDMYAPKTVDELRTVNNPKCAYSLNGHMGPAIQPVTNQGIQGAVVKKLPDTTFANDNNLGMVPGASGMLQQTQKPHQMLTEENRPSTSVEYYGARGSNQKQTSYVSGTYMDPNKQQLPHIDPTNMVATNTHPTNQSNYGKDSYTVLSNNRNTTSESYFGSIGGLISNMVEPVVKGLRHSQKTNIVANGNPVGFVNGGYKNPSVFNPNAKVDTTNREMYEGKLSMKHLNVQKQDATAYMNTRPLLNDTQRITMNQEQSGPAQSMNQGKKNYQAEYNQRNKNRIHACDVKSGGNMKLFNNKVNIHKANKESCNERQTPFYNPQSNHYEHPSELLGTFTNMPQTFENKNETMMDSSLLQAFKQNPYTQSLQSVV